MILEIRTAGFVEIVSAKDILEALQGYCTETTDDIIHDIISIREIEEEEAKSFPIFNDGNEDITNLYDFAGGLHHDGYEHLVTTDI